MVILISVSFLSVKIKISTDRTEVNLFTNNDGKKLQSLRK